MYASDNCYFEEIKYRLRSSHPQLFEANIVLTDAPENTVSLCLHLNSGGR